ncbi:MAG TPA: hypothetical protein VGJ03_03425 [Acidimicrobiales bacterium]|jgi:hypothetical protein
MNTQPREVTGWVGWIAFGATILGLAGIFQVMAGVTGIFNDDYYVTNKDGLVLKIDYTAWGWTHLIVGLFLIIGAVSLFSGRGFGRVIAVIAAFVSAVVNLAFINAAPVWSTIIITLDVLVIFAVIAHGREMQT